MFFGKLLGGATVAVLQGALVLVSLAFTAVGLLIASRLRSFEGFGVFSNALILPLYFLASSVFPLNPSLSVQQQQVFPPWLVLLVLSNPVTYAVDLLRSFIINYHEHPLGLDIGVVLALTAVTCLLSYRSFQR